MFFMAEQSNKSGSEFGLRFVRVSIKASILESNCTLELTCFVYNCSQGGWLKVGDVEFASTSFKLTVHVEFRS